MENKTNSNFHTISNFPNIEYFGTHLCDKRNTDGYLYWTAIWIIQNVTIDWRNLWLAHNDEYGTEIEYCPFCWEKLP